MTSVSCIARVVMLINFALIAASENSSAGATIIISVNSSSNDSFCALSDNETDSLLEVFFNRECLLTLNTTIGCPLQAANRFVQAFSGGLRIENLIVNVWTVLAGASLMQAGGIPIPCDRAGTGYWALWMLIVLFQWLTVQFSLLLIVAAYLAAVKQMSPCMVPWKAEGGMPLLHVAVLPYFAFQPRFFFLLYSGTLYIEMMKFGIVLIEVARGRGSLGWKFPLDFRWKFIECCLGIYGGRSVWTCGHVLFALFFLAWVCTAAAVFGLAFFLPMTFCTAAGICVSICLIRALRQFVIQPVWKIVLGFLPVCIPVPPSLKDTSLMFWWMQFEHMTKFDDHGYMKFFQFFNGCMLAIAALSPSVCYGGLLAWYIYGGHTIDDNMNMVRMLYRHHLQVFWDWEFEMSGPAEIWKSMFDCGIKCYAKWLFEALKFVAGLGNLIDLEPADFLAGSVAVMSLNFILSIMKPVVPLLNAALLFCRQKEKEGEDRNMSIFVLCAGGDCDRISGVKRQAAKMADVVAAKDTE